MTILFLFIILKHNLFLVSCVDKCSENPKFVTRQKKF